MNNKYLVIVRNMSLLFYQQVVDMEHLDWSMLCFIWVRNIYTPIHSYKIPGDNFRYFLGSQTDLPTCRLGSLKVGLSSQIDWMTHNENQEKPFRDNNGSAWEFHWKIQSDRNILKGFTGYINYPIVYQN